MARKRNDTPQAEQQADPTFVRAYTRFWGPHAADRLLLHAATRASRMAKIIESPFLSDIERKVGEAMKAAGEKAMASLKARLAVLVPDVLGTLDDIAEDMLEAHRCGGHGESSCPHLRDIDGRLAAERAHLDKATAGGSPRGTLSTKAAARIAALEADREAAATRFHDERIALICGRLASAASGDPRAVGDLVKEISNHTAAYRDGLADDLLDALATAAESDPEWATLLSEQVEPTMPQVEWQTRPITPGRPESRPLPGFNPNSAEGRAAVRVGLVDEAGMVPAPTVVPTQASPPEAARSAAVLPAFVVPSFFPPRPAAPAPDPAVS